VNTLRRIKAVLIQEYFITLNSMEVFMDIFFFPSMTIILFGFLSSYLTGSGGGNTGHIVLMGMLLWEIVFIAQYSVSVGSLWNIWSRNLSNMFITPLDIKEYIFAHVVSGSIKSLLVFLLTAGLSVLVFDYNIFGLGLINLFLFYINLLMFAVAVGLAILGLIFAYGTRIQAFAWGLLPIFQPLTAALYPVEVLPFPLKETAYVFPPTYIFESARKSLVTGGVVWDQILISFLINILYVVLSILFFRYMFRRSRISGQFARNEG
jgi:ABC-2 type transport system permease protein